MVIQRPAASDRTRLRRLAALDATLPAGLREVGPGCSDRKGGARRACDAGKVSGGADIVRGLPGPTHSTSATRPGTADRKARHLPDDGEAVTGRSVRYG